MTVLMGIMVKYAWAIILSSGTLIGGLLHQWVGGHRAISSGKPKDKSPDFDFELDDGSTEKIVDWARHHPALFFTVYGLAIALVAWMSYLYHT